MAKLNWDPWFDFKNVAQELDRALNESVAPGAERCPVFTPLADVYECEDALRIEVELPGVEREDVVVELKDNELWIYGERSLREACGAYCLLERPRGRFLRRFELPKSVRRSRVSAVMRLGLLEITLQKRRPEELRRRIPVI